MPVSANGTAAARHPAMLRLLLAAAIGVPLLVTAAGAWLSWRQAWNEAERETGRAADAAAEFIGRALDGLLLRIDRANGILNGMTDAQVREREAELHESLRRAATARARWSGPREPYLFVFDRDAVPLVAGNVYPVSRDSFRDREFNQVLRGADAPPFAISPVYVGAQTGEQFFALTARRERTGNPASAGGYDGIINASVYVDEWEAALRQLGGGPRGDVISAIRADGQILARSLPVAAGTAIGGNEPVFARMQAGATALMVHARSPVDGVWRIGAYRRVPGYPVFTAAVRPSDEVLRAWAVGVLPLVAAGISATLALLALGMLVGRQQRELAEANALLEGRVARRTEALAISESRARLAMRGAGLGSWEFDLARGCFGWSARLSEIYGDPAVPREDVPLADWLARLHPDDVARAEAAFRGALEMAADITLEHRIRTADRGWRWVAVHGAVDGAEIARGVAQDVTDRRTADERQRLLVREVDHRAKNALAVVLAAIRLARSDDVESFSAAIEGRVAAMARTHELLAAGRWVGTDLAELAKAELSPFTMQQFGPPRALVEGPSLLVDSTAAQALSMVLHELATNATKHGALSCAEGRVALRWALDDEAGMLRLSWSEQGGPTLRGEPVEQGFGSQVIEAILREQLGGTLRREWQPGGLSLWADIPLSALLTQAHAEPAEPQPA